MNSKFWQFDHIFNLILILWHAVNDFIVSTYSIIHAGSMLSSQRLNKVMAEVSEEEFSPRKFTRPPNFFNSLWGISLMCIYIRIPNFTTKRHFQSADL